MTSIERIKQYAKLEPEAAEHNDYPLPAEWPTGGAITFDNVTLTYIEGHQPAVKNVSFTIKSKEKVLIVNTILTIPPM